MTPEPSFESVVTVTAPLYAVNLPVVPILLAVLVVIAVALVVRSRSSRRTRSSGE